MSGFGYLVILFGLLFMIIGLIAGIGKWRLGRHGLLFLLLFIQLWLAWIGFELPFPVGFLHPINAFLIAGLCGWIVWDETQRRRGPLPRRYRRRSVPVATPACCGACRPP